jgi:hypothetical protein
MIEALAQWARGLGANYGVNPWIFASIYIGAVPFFLGSMAWAVKRARTGRSAIVPLLCAGFCFISSYLYLAVAGRNVPIWVWIFLGSLIVIGAISAVRDYRRKLRDTEHI